MKKVLFIISLALLVTGCFSHTTMMSRETYDDIPLGTSVVDMTSMAGEPYRIRSKGGGIDEYEYIERVDLGNSIVTENHYFFLVSRGQVVGKRITQEKLPAYDLIYQEDPNYPNLRGGAGN